MNIRKCPDCYGYGTIRKRVGKNNEIKRGKKIVYSKCLTCNGTGTVGHDAEPQEIRSSVARLKP